MSEQHPSSGAPEYLEYGSGDPIPPEPTPPASPQRRGRRAWWIAGGVVAVLGAGAGAWAAMSFFQQGEQPAQALPSSTVAYLSIDLDPSGGQKIDAFRTLNKFPAFKDEVGVSSVDDIRQKVGDAILEGPDCKDLSYSHDIDPWLGDRAAAAAVDLGAGKTAFVIVIQVKDEDKTRAAITSFNSCDKSEPPAGFVVHDGWALLAKSQDVADQVSQATDKGTLADDATYQKWTKAVGDAGVVNAYAAPDAGRLLGKKLTGLFAFPVGESVSSSATAAGYMSQGSRATVSSTLLSGVSSGVSSKGSGAADDAHDPYTRALAGFQGGAATIRFTGSGLEVAMAGEGSSSELTELTGSAGGELVSRLPDDTAAAAGITFQPGWLGRQLDSFANGLGGMSGDDATRELSRATGLDVPDDIETLLGSGVALSVSKDFDLEAAENSSDGTGVPVAATIKGDPTAIQRVLDKIRAKTGDVPWLGSDSSDGLVVLGPTPDYRKQVLTGGHLGDDGTFTSVVPDAAHASSVLYANVDELEPIIAQASPDDPGTLANLVPLRAVGLSTWTDNGVIRFSFKVSVN